MQSDNWSKELRSHLEYWGYDSYKQFIAPVISTDFVAGKNTTSKYYVLFVELLKNGKDYPLTEQQKSQVTCVFSLNAISIANIQLKENILLIECLWRYYMFTHMSYWGAVRFMEALELAEIVI